MKKKVIAILKCVEKVIVKYFSLSHKKMWYMDKIKSPKPHHMLTEVSKKESHYSKSVKK